MVPKIINAVYWLVATSQSMYHVLPYWKYRHVSYTVNMEHVSYTVSFGLPPKAYL
jgi:hypothetical protein